MFGRGEIFWEGAEFFFNLVIYHVRKTVTYIVRFVTEQIMVHSNFIGKKQMVKKQTDINNLSTKKYSR